MYYIGKIQLLCSNILVLKQVMLLGHRDGFTADRVMKVTVAFNHFGPGLVQRMPRYHSF